MTPFAPLTWMAWSLWTSVWQKAHNAYRFLNWPIIEVSDTYKEYYESINKRLQYLQKSLFDLGWKNLQY